MNIGIARMKFRLFGVRSLKEKRSISKRIMNYLRKSHNVSISEIEAQDSKDFLVLGFAMVSTSRDIIHNTFESIANYIELHEGLEMEEMEKELW
jgi:uncharacterized protein YlxP (DUF503 family)